MMRAEAGANGVTQRKQAIPPPRSLLIKLLLLLTLARLPFLAFLSHSLVTYLLVW